MTEQAETKRISLPKTKLYVSDGRLVRQSPTNQTVSEIALDSITDISVRMETDWPVIIFPLGLFVIAGACKWFLHSVAIGWLLCIVLAILGLLSLLGLKRPLLTVQTRDGQVTFEVKDTFPDAEAFTLSIKQQINGRTA
jgi:hypothetical protein